MDSELAPATNLTYKAPSVGFVAYLDLPLGDIPAYASGSVELDSIWVPWGLDVCPREYEFRVSMAWADVLRDHDSDRVTA